MKQTQTPMAQAALTEGAEKAAAWFREACLTNCLADGGKACAGTWDGLPSLTFAQTRTIR